MKTHAIVILGIAALAGLSACCWDVLATTGWLTAGGIYVYQAFVK